MQELTIAQINARMKAGELTAVALCQAYLDQIERLDAAGPTLNAIIERNPDALEIAEALDRERAQGKVRGPLHGVPVVLKDNIDTADRMATSAGSLALADSIASQDATLVTKLRQAGAVILAKANLSEWANFRSTHSSSGWSSRGGQTRNPYALDRNPCGSSSGSAVAVAANLCAVAVGTETDGSIICPSQANGVVGIKPTVGLVSRAGVIPIAHSQDTAGPMGRTVTDAAALLGAMTGQDPLDPATMESGARHHQDYTRFLDPAGLQGARIGVARNFFGFHPQVDAVMERCLEVLRDSGAELVDPANIETVDKFRETEIAVFHFEFKTDINAYLAQLDPEVPIHSLEGLIAFNEAHSQEAMPYFGQDLLIEAQTKGPLTSETYLEALAANHRYARDEGIDAVLAAHGLDAIVAPSGGPAWLTDWVNGDHYGGGSSSPAAVAGYPSITVPAGLIFGLPVGISFIGGAYQEPTLIRLAHAFEGASQARRPPRFLSSAPLENPEP